MSPEEWIVGGRDGLGAVPREFVEEIFGAAEEKVATENKIRSSVRSHTLPLEAYELYGKF